MQAGRCSISSRLIRNSGHGEGSWIALAETEKELGLPITDEQIEELKAHADDINYDVAKEREKIVRHDVMSHVYAYGAAVPESERNHSSGSDILLCGR